MNDSFLFNTLVQPLGWTLVHSLWQGLLIAAVTGAALFTLRRRSARSRYLIACSGLIGIVLAFAVTIAWQISAVPRRTRGTPAIASPQPTPIALAIVTPKAEKTVIPGISSAPAKEFAPHDSRSVLGWLVLAWALGVTGLSLRSLGAWRRLRSLRVGASPVIELPLLRRLRELADRLGLRREVRLLTSAALEVPATLGWLKPFIVLPAATMAGLSPAQLECILLHELAHIRRHDYLVNLAQIAIENLLFYHPAVWWVSKRIREEREFCCDDLVLQHQGDGLEYARALAKLEEARSLQLSLALAANDGPLLRRIRRISGGASTQGTPLPIWPLAVGLLLCVLALPFARAAVVEKPASASHTETAGVLPTTKNLPQEKPSGATNGVTILMSEIAALERKLATYRLRLQQEEIDGRIEAPKTASGAPESELGRAFAAEMAQLPVQIMRMESNLAQLKKRSFEELKAMLPTVTPDPVLISLLQAESKVQQELAELSVDFGPNSPNVRSKRALADTVQEQIERKCQGILEGLEVALEQQRATLKQMRLGLNEFLSKEARLQDAREGRTGK